MCPGIDSSSKNEYQEDTPGSKAGRCVRLRTYHLHVPNVKKIRGLNVRDSHGPVQACSGTALLYSHGNQTMRWYSCVCVCIYIYIYTFFNFFPIYTLFTRLSECIQRSHNERHGHMYPINTSLNFMSNKTMSIAFYMWLCRLTRVWWTVRDALRPRWVNHVYRAHPLLPRVVSLSLSAASVCWSAVAPSLYFHSQYCSNNLCSNTLSGLLIYVNRKGQQEKRIRREGAFIPTTQWISLRGRSIT
jgi:hypothetical protein